MHPAVFKVYGLTRYYKALTLEGTWKYENNLSYYLHVAEISTVIFDYLKQHGCAVT